MGAQRIKHLTISRITAAGSDRTVNAIGGHAVGVSSQEGAGNLVGRDHCLTAAVRSKIETDLKTRQRLGTQLGRCDLIKRGRRTVADHRCD
jgi:hypothetical protein